MHRYVQSQDFRRSVGTPLNNDKYDLQIMQNDALRFCKGAKLLDKVAVKKLHDSIKLLSLEHRRQKQLLDIMFNQASKGR